MKKYIIFLSIFFVYFSGAALSSQGSIPEKLKEIVTLPSIALSYIVIVAISLILTQLSKKALNKTALTPNWAVRYLSHFMSFVFTWVLSHFDLIDRLGPSILHILGFSMFTAFTSNGIFDMVKGVIKKKK